MSLGATEGRDKLSSLDNLSIEIYKEGFRTFDLLSAFVKAGGSAMDLADLLSPEFDLKEELLSDRVKVLAKTDCLARHDKEASKHTSRFYNWFSNQMIGHCGNWVFAQPVTDWCLASYKSDHGNLDSLMKMSLGNVSWGDPPCSGDQSINGTAWVWESLMLNV